MPGIFGLITTMPSGCARQKLAQMIGAMRHDQRYVSGTFVDETDGLYAAWTARAGSFAADLPLSSEDGDISILFAGEDFSASEAANQPRRSGSVAKRNPASYLVEAYEREPDRFPRALNGRFQALIQDRIRRNILLANDRYGMQRVYYHEGSDAFYFSAEAKAILAACPHLRKISSKSLGEFVSVGCVLDNRSLFDGIGVLPPASAWRFRNGTVAGRERYFSPEEWENQDPLEGERFYQSVRNVFSGSIDSYFRSHERVGVSLTGGLDSRMLMAWGKERTAGLPCYSFGGMFRTCQDVAIARKVAAACGCSHQTIPVAREFLSKFPSYAERSIYLTDGCIEVSHSPDLYVNEQVAAIAPIRLTGNYGSEVLRRVRAFKPMRLSPGIFTADIVHQEQVAQQHYREIIKGHPLSFALFRQAPWHHYGLLSLEQTQVTVRSPFLDNAFVQTLFRAPDSSWLNNQVSLRLIADGNPALSRIPTDRGLVRGQNGVPARAMRDLIEFTVKAEYAYDYGMPDWLAKADRLLSPLHLEKLFLGRHKFYHFRYWYRHSLGSYVQQILLDSKTLSRSFFVKKGLESLVRDHLRGTRNCTLQIHKALTIELMHRLFID